MPAGRGFSKQPRTPHKRPRFCQGALRAGFAVVCVSVEIATAPNVHGCGYILNERCAE
jgi:hypothetical protein